MLRPKQCIWPGSSGQHNVCLCVIQEIFSFLLEAIEEARPSDDYANSFLCPFRTRNCFLRLCQDCPNFIELDEPEPKITKIFYLTSDVNLLKYHRNTSNQLSHRSDLRVYRFSSKFMISSPFTPEFWLSYP